MADREVRIIFTDDPGGAMPEYRGKVFALIGPFESHQDMEGLQLMIGHVIRQHNQKVRK